MLIVEEGIYDTEGGNVVKVDYKGTNEPRYYILGFRFDYRICPYELGEMLHPPQSLDHKGSPELQGVYCMILYPDTREEMIAVLAHYGYTYTSHIFTLDEENPTIQGIAKIAKRYC